MVFGSERSYVVFIVSSTYEIPRENFLVILPYQENFDFLIWVTSKYGVSIQYVLYTICKEIHFRILVFSYTLNEKNTLILILFDDNRYICYSHHDFNGYIAPRHQIFVYTIGRPLAYEYYANAFNDYVCQSDDVYIYGRIILWCCHKLHVFL